MDIFTASEASYINGYKRGYVDALLELMPKYEIEEEYFTETDEAPKCTTTKS